MQWNKIVGHDENVNSLKAMLVNGRVPHALLFVGPEGVGKAVVATIFAAGLLCTGEGRKPCGECSSCCRVRSLSHPDLVVMSPDGASIKIDQVRELQRIVALAPYFGQRRVCIINAAETMTIQAANSLLKTLEEPPGDTVFILISSARQQLLPTIISRCRIMPFYSLSYEVLSKALIAQGFDHTQAGAAARISGGRMGAALDFLAEDGLIVRNQAADIVAALPECPPSYIWETAPLFDKLERRQALELYKHMTLILRDVLVYVAVKDAALLFNADIGGRLATVAYQWSEHSLLNALKAVEFARRALVANANIRLTSEALLIKMRDAARED
jgi:DNA polymerase-3 subunit delta'